MALRNRKFQKMRGTRTCGAGSHKKNRGKGNRGGRGMAGTHKGKWTWVVKNAPNYFGREKGFKMPNPERSTIINLHELDERIEELISEGLAKKKGDKVEIDITDINCDKVLGKGKITKPLIVKAPSFSGIAKRKIEEAGGEAVSLGE